MPYCKYCKAFIDEGTVCDACKSKIDREDPACRIREEVRSAKDHTAEFDPVDIENNTGISVLAYLGPLFLIPYFARQTSPYARFHARQGMVLFLCQLVIGIVFEISFALLGNPIFLLRPLLRAAETLFQIICIAYSVFGWVNLANKRAKELPFIGRFAPKDHN